MEVKVEVEFVCGCGFRTIDKERAIDHVATTKHTLFAKGKISPTTKEKR